MRYLIAVLLILIALTLTLSAVSASPAMADGDDLLTSLVGWWSLDEANGTRADAHGSNSLTDNNTVGQATGKVSNAADFVAANSEYLSHADNADLSTGDIDFTIAAWVYLDDTSTDRDLVSKFDPTGDQREYLLTYRNALDRFTFWVSSDGTNTGLLAVQSDQLGAPTTAAWYFIVAYHDSVTNEIGIIVNDGVQDTAAHSTGVLDSVAPMQFGSRVGSGYTEGRIDEVAFWKRLLTGAERTFLYNSGNGRAYSEIGPPAPTATPGPTTTATPTHTPTATPDPVIINDNLPYTGQAFRIERSATFGDIFVGSAMMALIAINFINLLMTGVFRA